MISTEDLRRLLHGLGDACGLELKLVEESVFAEGDFFSATARSPRRSDAAGPVHLEALAKVQISPTGAGGMETWALVFFINRQRVAPPGLCHLTLKHERADNAAGRWVLKGWEADAYEEWTGLERLEDEGER